MGGIGRRRAAAEAGRERGPPAPLGSDDGAGGAAPACGSGLTGLRDRAEALGGSLEISSPPSHGMLFFLQLRLRLR